MALLLGSSLSLVPGCNKDPNKNLNPASTKQPPAGKTGSASGNPSSATTTQLRAPASENFVTFQDLTNQSGVVSIYDNGEKSAERSILESLGGGVGVCDYDLDGRWDLFFPGGGEIIRDQPLPGAPGTLWRNLGDMKFAAVAPLAHIDRAPHYTHGCAMGDYDADGFPDVLVTGYGGIQLFRNQGDGTFLECSETSGFIDPTWSSSAAWGDLNDDGQLDAFVVHYVDWSWQKNPVCDAPIANEREVCSPQDFSPLLDTIFFNNGDGTFSAANRTVGIKTLGKGLGVIAVDVNQDAKLDVYVANDTTNNLLFMNQGEGKFKEMGVISGTALDERGVANGSMGIAVLDYDNDLKPDIWVTNYENETFALYHNDDRGMFRCVTQSTGITAIGSLFVGFGTTAADFTRSGREDLVVSNGHVMLYPRYSPIQQPALYVRNQGQGKLERLQFPTDDYFSLGHRGRGVVAVDLNQDDKLDLVFSHVQEPATLLQQTTKLSGNWLEYSLVGRQSNRDAIGARVIVDTDSGSMMRTIIGGGSYLSQNPYCVNFGIPAGTNVQRVTIFWPNGTSQRIENPELNQRAVIVEEANPKNG